MKTNEFEQHVAVMEMKQAHEMEIQQSRVGGLGGSDATIILKIGQNGMQALSPTDHKRLAVMMGLTDMPNWSGNAYTNAGHLFEDYAEETCPWGGGYEREKVLSQPLARNFKVFAHADFAIGEKRDEVVECKFVQEGFNSVKTKYYAQLQWYYMLGAKTVALLHGRGNAEPFEVLETELQIIERDDETIKFLLAGLKTLDEAIASGWKPEVFEKTTIDDCPQTVADAFKELERIHAEKKHLDEAEKAAKDVLKNYLEAFDLSGIMSTGGEKHQIIYNKAQIRKTFDVQKFAKDNPSINLSGYYKNTKVTASVTFK